MTYLWSKPVVSFWWHLHDISAALGIVLLPELLASPSFHAPFSSPHLSASYPLSPPDHWHLQDSTALSWPPPLSSNALSVSGFIWTPDTRCHLCARDSYFHINTGTSPLLREALHILFSAVAPWWSHPLSALHPIHMLKTPGLYSRSTSSPSPRLMLSVTDLSFPCEGLKGISNSTCPNSASDRSL